MMLPPLQCGPPACLLPLTVCLPACLPCICLLCLLAPWTASFQQECSLPQRPVTKTYHQSLQCVCLTCVKAVLCTQSTNTLVCIVCALFSCFQLARQCRKCVLYNVQFTLALGYYLRAQFEMCCVNVFHQC